MSSTPFALEARDLSRCYRNRWALAGVHLELPPGRSLLLAGANGSGKTTLLRLLATSLRPSRGWLRIHGIDPTAAPQEARQTLALLTHRTQLYAHLTGRENLSVAQRMRGFRPEAARLQALLDRVGLGDRGDDTVATYSAGMKKRLAFARVLLQDPRVVLLDEPYGQLDPSGFALVDGLLTEMAKEGRTLVVATHLVDRLAPALQSGLILAGGRPSWVGKAADLPAALAKELGT